MLNKGCGAIMPFFTSRMKLLGIDYGEKRVGIALSDEGGTIAFPKNILDNDNELLKKIYKITKNEEVGVIIIGESTDYKGNENPIMERIKSFKERLEDDTLLPVFYEPEFLSSQEARNMNETAKVVDAGAAAIILQSYIDRTKNKKDEQN